MPQAGYAMFEVTSGNGVELIVNGEPMMKHLNPYRSASHKEKVLLSLPEGRSTVAVRSYNRFEKVASVGFAVDAEADVYRKVIALPSGMSASGLSVRLSASDCESAHKDCLLHNLRLCLK